MDSQAQTRFDRALDDLDRAGSSLLVVGTVPDDRFGEVSESLLGDPGAGPRRQLFVTTDDAVDAVRSRLPDQSVISPRQGVRVITVSDSTRGAIRVDSADTDILPTTRVDGDDIDRLAQTILDTIDEFDRLATGLQPSELRVSVGPLASLIDRHGQETVFRMIHVLNHLIREKEGMAHFHLPVQRESGIVRRFQSLFDAVIELRLQQGRLEQRWHLQKPETSSEWLPV